MLHRDQDALVSGDTDGMAISWDERVAPMSAAQFADALLGIVTEFCA